MVGFGQANGCFLMVWSVSTWHGFGMLIRTTSLRSTLHCFVIICADSWSAYTPNNEQNDATCHRTQLAQNWFEENTSLSMNTVTTAFARHENNREFMGGDCRGLLACYILRLHISENNRPYDTVFFQRHSNHLWNRYDVELPHVTVIKGGLHDTRYLIHDIRNIRIDK